jgi:hypothetical protein
MANIRQLASGHWQVQIRLKGRKATETFIRHDHAREWTTESDGWRRGIPHIKIPETGVQFYRDFSGNRKALRSHLEYVESWPPAPKIADRRGPGLSRSST